MAVQAERLPAELLADVQLSQPPDSAALLQSLQAAAFFLAAAGDLNCSLPASKLEPPCELMAG